MDDDAFSKLLDDTLQSKLGYPSEPELIEILNKYEYQLQLVQESPAISKLGDGGAEQMRQVVLIREHLARRQGGELDRFGLRELSLIELEHRRKETAQAIEQMETKQAGRPSKDVPKAGSLADFFVGFGQLLTGPDPLTYQLFVKKKLLSEIDLGIRFKQSRPARKLTVAEQVTEQKKASLKKIAELKIACEETLQHTPDALKPDIDRSYRKEIDRIREEEL